MSYVPGTKIDLTYLNKEVATNEYNSFQEATSTLLEVGTSFVFRQGKAFRKIPVAFV